MRIQQTYKKRDDIYVYTDYQTELNYKLAINILFTIINIQFERIKHMQNIYIYICRLKVVVYIVYETKWRIRKS